MVWKKLQRLNIIILVLVQACLLLPANAEEIFSITMSEGYYPQTNTADDKFGALVVVRSSQCANCEGKELGRFRGSTLPNAYWYYKDQQGVALWKDGKIQSLFAALRKQAQGLDSFYFGSLKPILQLFDKEWPIVSSGEYSFAVKEQRVFQPRALRVNEGKFVRTENPNPIQHYAYAAEGIWIHKGVFSGENKGSEGCLTIRPEDWDDFIQLFPKESEWRDNQSIGILWIIRLLAEGQEPPSFISIPATSLFQNDETLRPTPQPQRVH